MRLGPAMVVALLLVLVVWSAPLANQDAPHSIYNEGELGLDGWVETPIIMHGPVRELDPQTSLLVVAPRLSYSQAEAEAFRLFLTQGGRALVVDSTGSARSLLSEVPVDILPSSVFSTSYEKTPRWPITTSYGFGLPETVTLSRPHVVEGAGTPLLTTHRFTWIDRDNDLEPDLDEPVGAWPVAMHLRFGAGELIVIGDSDWFTQDASQEAAAALMPWLQERPVVVDEGHRVRSDPLRSTDVLSGAATGWAVFVGALVVAVAVWTALDMRVGRRRPAPVRREVAVDPAILAELPDPS